MAKDVYATLKDCRLCARYCKVNNKRETSRLFPPSGPLQYVAMHILRALTKTKYGRLFFVIGTGRQSKLARAVPIFLRVATAVAAISVHHWTSNFGIRSTIPMLTVCISLRISFKRSELSSK